MPHAGVPTVPDSALSLGGISLDDGQSSVVARLGEPTRRNRTGDFLNVQVAYPGLTIWLGEGGRVGEILSTSSKYCTPQGACPGQPFAQVKALYGEPLVAIREDGQFMEYFPHSDFPCWLQISVKAGSVKSIRSECQP